MIPKEEFRVETKRGVERPYCGENKKALKLKRVFINKITPPEV